MKNILCLLLFLPSYLFAQNIAPLTVEKIMRDPQWIGTSPSNIFWSADGQKLYFKWNPKGAISDSLYFITLNNHTPQKATPQQRVLAKAQHRGSWNFDRSKKVFVKGQTLYVLAVSSHKLKPLLRTAQNISHPVFKKHGEAVVYRQGNNLYMINLKTGFLTQLTDFESGHKKKEQTPTAQEKFLEKDALANSKILRQRKTQEEAAERNAYEPAHAPKTIYTGHKRLTHLSLSPDGHKVIYQLVKRPNVKRTKVPNYVTQSGYTTNISSRPVVGATQTEFTTYIYNRQTDTVYAVSTKQIPGIHDIPKFYKHYPQKLDSLKKNPPLRSVYMSKPIWNAAGTRAFVVIRALDHKDRWLMLLNAENGQLELLDRQHDDAWIGGPGIGYPHAVGNVGWIDENSIWYQSEKTGYSHLYTMNVVTKKKNALTAGEYEVYAAQLSPDHKTFYIMTNKVAPGQRQFYQLNIKSEKQTRITQKVGGYRVHVSPDGKHLAMLFSTNTHPWELFLQKNEPEAAVEQITHKAETAEFKSYAWRDPEIFTYTNRDGLEVYAKVFEPDQPASTRPAVIFVHGAGYLQDVVEYWSDPYFREHLFMNFLADQGYTVMEMDYRGSKGYGRDWRTAIYRHMGGNDLEDVVDGAKYLVEHYNINPDKIGVWGGSYGGFMTLMALFKTDAFASGAALRSVTDWAHYNHPYTSDILNLPQNDPLAYKQSSPIYFAKGLQDALLMCHGMVDPNVHFQDIVRLTQKLIELGKENWELAIYPVEGHGFVEPSSWADEYRRIFELFEANLK